MQIWGWGVLVVLAHQFTCNHNFGQDDSHIESLLQLLFHETTEVPLSSSNTPQVLPYFLSTNSSTNLSIQLGGLVIFHCWVNDLADDTTVSWLRRQNSHLLLLSVGGDTYSPDPRLSAAFVPPNDWQLRLLSAQTQDQGLYQCQVSSHPPIVCTIYLQVTVPELQITDERGWPITNKFYNTGSTIQMTCVVNQMPQDNNRITWTREGKVLNRDVARGGISVKTSVKAGGALSRLFIANALPNDSGNYTCCLADILSASVFVHVLEGETPAAMQHGTSTSRSSSLNLCVSSLLFLLFR